MSKSPVRPCTRHTACGRACVAVTAPTAWLCTCPLMRRGRRPSPLVAPQPSLPAPALPLRARLRASFVHVGSDTSALMLHGHRSEGNGPTDTHQENS